MRIISLGWGVQSFALACMSALGVLPPVDAAVHADTGHERAETYALAEKMTPWLEARGVRVVTVRGGQRTAVEEHASVSVMIAAFTSWPDGKPSGMLRRQCTHDWKIAPMRRWFQKHRDGKRVEQWIGITLDEVTRMRSSDVQYIENAYPLIQHFERAWTRTKVKQWLLDNDLPIPVKSSCVFCTYRDRATWHEIKLSENGDWEKAVAVDAAIRDKRPGYLCYICSQRKPLPECDFRSQEDYGQLTMWEAEECQGMCFL